MAANGKTLKVALMSKGIWLIFGVSGQKKVLPPITIKLTKLDLATLEPLYDGNPST